MSKAIKDTASCRPSTNPLGVDEYVLSNGSVFLRRPKNKGIVRLTKKQRAARRWLYESVIPWLDSPSDAQSANAKKIKTRNKQIVSKCKDAVYGQVARRHSHEKRRSAQVTPSLREAEIEILRTLAQKTTMTIAGLAAQANLHPLSFASTVSKLSKEKLIDMRGAACRILLKEANRAVTEAGQNNEAPLVAWRRNLIALERDERLKDAHLLRVAAASVKLSKTGRLALAKLAADQLKVA